MAGAGLINIKRRIKSVTNTQKITRAMGLVSTSKLRKCREKLKPNQRYSATFENTIKDLITGYEGSNKYTQDNKSSNELYIILTSDSGLCGSFNSSLLKTVYEKIEGKEDTVKLIIVGQKGRTFFNRYKFESAAEYVDIDDVPTVKEGRTISEKARSLYEKGEVGKVYIAYTKFINTIKQDVTIEKLLPFEVKDADKTEKYIDFEPERGKIIETIVPIYLNQKILNFMLNSKISEQATRMSAMDGATKNASDLLDDLNLKYNKVRQGAITQEITEIVGGSEALK